MKSKYCRMMPSFDRDTLLPGVMVRYTIKNRKGVTKFTGVGEIELVKGHALYLVDSEYAPKGMNILAKDVLHGKTLLEIIGE